MMFIHNYPVRLYKKRGDMNAKNSFEFVNRIIARQ